MGLPMSKLPHGPRVPPPLQLLKWVFAPVSFMQACADRYGDTFTVRMLGVPPMVFFTDPGAIRQIGRVRRAIRELLHDEVRRRRAAGPEERTDVMSMLVAARDEDGSAMSDEEVGDEMFTMLVAGHETTATLIAWVIHRLLEHPDALAAARAEVASVVGNGPHLPPPDADQIARLGYLDAAI